MITKLEAETKRPMQTTMPGSTTPSGVLPQNAKPVKILRNPAKVRAKNPVMTGMRG
jgi:hypothetical protein